MRLQLSGYHFSRTKTEEFCTLAPELETTSTDAIQFLLKIHFIPSHKVAYFPTNPNFDKLNHSLNKYERSMIKQLIVFPWQSTLIWHYTRYKTKTINKKQNTKKRSKQCGHYFFYSHYVLPTTDVDNFLALKTCIPVDPSSGV